MSYLIILSREKFKKGVIWSQILIVFIKELKYYIDKRQTLAYIQIVKYLTWDVNKNELLKIQRELSFEEIAHIIESGRILSIEENKVHPNQKIYILKIEDYAVVVPFVETDNEIFLKTAFPSRKYTKRFGLGRKNEQDK